MQIKASSSLLNPHRLDRSSEPLVEAQNGNFVQEEQYDTADNSIDKAPPPLCATNEGNRKRQRSASTKSSDRPIDATKDRKSIEIERYLTKKAQQTT